MSMVSTTNSNLLGMLAGEALYVVHGEPLLLKVRPAMIQGLDERVWSPASVATGEDAF
jgi:hypothetical protein